MRDRPNALWHQAPAVAGVACAVATVVGAVVCLNEIRTWQSTPSQVALHGVRQLDTGMGHMTSMLGKTVEATEGVAPENSIYHQQSQGMVARQVSISKDGRTT